jgi:hypothetical protein
MVLKVTGNVVNKSSDPIQTTGSLGNSIPPKETPKRVVPREERRKIEGNKLIINGKEKAIGRKSHYLLDMMIIDEE